MDIEGSNTWKVAKSAAPDTAGKKRANSEVSMPAKKMTMTQSPVTSPKGVQSAAPDTAEKEANDAARRIVAQAINFALAEEVAEEAAEAAHSIATQAINFALAEEV